MKKYVAVAMMLFVLACFACGISAQTAEATYGGDDSVIGSGQTAGGQERSAGMKNFLRLHMYNNTFEDVPANSWYTKAVKTAYEYGIINGRTKTTYCPSEQVSCLEVITVAARIHAQYYQNEIEREDLFKNWYEPYVRYAYRNGLIDTDVVENVPADRQYTARIMSAVIDAEDMPALRGWKPFADVELENEYAEYIRQLYCAGIIDGTGNNKFEPHSDLTRAQFAMFIHRILIPAERISG